MEPALSGKCRLNIGADRRRDFTVWPWCAELDEDFARSGLAIERLMRHRLEGCGYVLEAGVPLIEVSHPQQIEVLR